MQITCFNDQNTWTIGPMQVAAAKLRFALGFPEETFFCPKCHKGNKVSKADFQVAMSAPPTGRSRCPGAEARRPGRSGASADARAGAGIDRRWPSRTHEHGSGPRDCHSKTGHGHSPKPACAQGSQQGRPGRGGPCEGPEGDGASHLDRWQGYMGTAWSGSVGGRRLQGRGDDRSRLAISAAKVSHSHRRGSRHRLDSDNRAAQQGRSIVLHPGDRATAKAASKPLARQPVLRDERGGNILHPPIRGLITTCPSPNPLFVHGAAGA